MQPGRFIAVVGPSGVGKDSVMDALCQTMPDLVRCRRTITRDPDAGGEDYIAVSEPTFASMVAQGSFVLHWKAHGLSYGIPKEVQTTLDAGTDMLANLSRSKLQEAQKCFERFVVLSITAEPHILAQRLAARGRESELDRVKRLKRSTMTLPSGLPVVTIDNSGSLGDAVSQAVDALQPASA